MNNLNIAIIKSSFQNLEKLNDRIYFEADKNGYFHLTTETKNGIQQSLFIFNGLKNKAHIEILINGYEYSNDAEVYFGKIEKLEEYISTEYSGHPIRIKIFVDNGEAYDIPLLSKEHLKLN
jgi:hypothetical protein